MGIYKKLGWFFKQEKKAYITGIVFLFFVALIQLVPPRIIGIIVDEVSEGTIYPLLLRLEKNGLVNSEKKESAFGPKRKYYKLTILGKEELTECHINKVVKFFNCSCVSELFISLYLAGQYMGNIR